MIRELTLRTIKKAFEDKGYVVEHIETQVESRIYDRLEATIEAGDIDGKGNTMIFGVFILCNILHNCDNPRMHSCEIYDINTGALMSSVHDSTGQIFVREVQGLLNQSFKY